MKINANQFTILAIGAIMLISAFGNAKIMFALSLIGLLLGLGFLRKNKEQSAVLAVTIGFFLVMIIAMVIWLTK